MTRTRSFTNAQVLRALQKLVVEHGQAPTVEELRQVLGVGSTRTALRYLKALEESGDIERWSGARGIRLLRVPRAQANARTVPIVGQAPAGSLMTAEQNVEGWLRLPSDFLRPASASYYLLRVRGNSMNRATVTGGSIEDGDLALVRQQAAANNGDVVVALIDGEATIKKFVKGPDYGLLKPVSSEVVHHPIVIKDNCRVQGIVQRVLKRGSELLAIVAEGEE